MTDETQPVKWYKQTAAWAVIISVVALILSQLPPIITWLPRESLKVETSDRIRLTNNIGQPGYAFQVDIKNTGNRKLTISNLTLILIYPSNKEKLNKAQSFSKYISDNYQEFPITNIEIKEGEGWSEWVLFYSTPSPSEEEEANRIRTKINDSFLSKIRKLPPNQYNPNYPVELEAKDVAEAVDAFNRRFEMEKGSYKASIKGDINGKTTLLKQFEFTLYDDHIRTYKSHTESYKYGYGLLSPIEPSKEVWVTIAQIK